MFEGGFDSGKGILSSVVGYAVVLIAIEGGNFMFPHDHNTPQ